MHIVVLAWLFVIFGVALTSPGPVAGALLFLGAGLGPVLVALALAARRRRLRASALEHQVRDADHREPQADQ